MQEALTPSVITAAFKSTGLWPLNADAIDKKKLVADADGPRTEICSATDITIPLDMQVWEEEGC